MRIACPTCSAEYEVPASRLTPGKAVRCAQCGGEWTASSDAEEIEPPRTAAPDPAAEVEGAPTTSAAPTAPPLSPPPLSVTDRIAAAPARPARNVPLISAWLVTWIVVAGAVAATIAWRENIIRVWPQSGWILGSTLGHAPPTPEHTATPEQPKGAATPH